MERQLFPTDESPIIIILKLKSKFGKSSVKTSHFIKKEQKQNVFALKSWSCYPDLNWGPHPYQGCALPTEL